ARSFGGSEVWRHAALQANDQVLIHVLVVVGDVETDHLLAAEFLPILRSESGKVAPLHHEDDIRPTEVSGRDPYPCARLGTHRAYLVAASTLEHDLRREAALAIAAADEQNFHNADTRCGLTLELTRRR